MILVIRSFLHLWGSEMAEPLKAQIKVINVDAAKVVIEEIFRPLLLHLYDAADLQIPVEGFDPAIEGLRLVATLRTQGFNTRFPGKA